MTEPVQRVPASRPDQAGNLYGRFERLALALGALLMLAVVGASVLIARRTQDDTADAKRAQAAVTQTTDMMDAAMSAETGQRGFLLTGRPEYLAPFLYAQGKVPLLRGMLAYDLARDPGLAPWLAAVDDKMAELAETIRLRQAGRQADALALVQTGRGRQDMLRIRAIAAGIAARQVSAASAALDHSQAGARLLVAVDAGALVLLVMLAAFVIRSLDATLGALGRSRVQLEGANAALEAGRERLEAAVAERTHDLTEANEEIQRFAYIVSHDLRAPLLNIVGFTGELTEATERLNLFVSENLEAAGIVVPADVAQASREDLPEAIRFIRTSTTKMDRLITAILRLAREGRRVLVPERLDMGALLAGIADSVHHQAEAAGLVVELGPVPPAVSDRLAVEQVFSNLVENALKYTRAGVAGRIAITGGMERGLLRYDVADNGRGIAARDLERIFELFRRAGTQDTAGEGIGLAHVRALLRRLGGTIVCESTPGVGSTFIVRLPPVLAPSAMLRDVEVAG